MPYLTSKQVSKITGCSLRQLQYWREQNVIIPVLNAPGKGKSVLYEKVDIVAVIIMIKLLNTGLDYQKACNVLTFLQEKNVDFSDDGKIDGRYLIILDSENDSIKIVEFEVESIKESLKWGHTFIPLLLDKIYDELEQKLKGLKMQKDSRDSNGKGIEESEQKTRESRIDNLLRGLGWKGCKYDDNLEISQLNGYWVEEYPLATGRADYVLVVNGLLVGAIEAKKVSSDPLSAMEQAKRYSRGAFDGVGDWRGYRIPFLYSTNGESIYFLDIRKEQNLTRPVSSFHTPSGLLELLNRNENIADDWLQNNPIEQNEYLRPYQVEAIASIENAIEQGKRELLVAMATGTGKTFTIVSSIYRLLASKRVKRVLFLVDRRALAAQAVRAFASFSTPNGKKFDQEYEVYSQQFKQEEYGEEDKFNSKVLPNKYLTEPSEIHTFVYVSTIQRMDGNLFGKKNNVTVGDTQNSGRFLDKLGMTNENDSVILNDSEESEGFLNKLGMTDDNGDYEFEDGAETLPIPIHAFDLIISDECHRGYTATENGSWRKVLDHFDAIKIGLTATPAIHTLNLFRDVVFRYSTEQAIADGYLVDYEQVNINSDVTINGTFLRQGEMVARIDRKTGEKFYDHLEDEREFNATDIERKITVPDRTRKIIQEIGKYALNHEEETGRFPKILIFACNDLDHTSHANQVVSICKEVFNRGDDFVQKITGKVDRPLQKIREFRNRPNPAIAVTVDLLTTGIDIPAIEFVVFMRFVKSRILWVQMLGRGTRLCQDINKTHFKVFDCFNGSLVEYFADSTDFRFVPPRQQSMPFSQVVGNIIYDVDRERHLDLLNRRLHRIDRSITLEGKEQSDLYLSGASYKGLARTFQDLFEEKPEEAIALLQDQEFIDFLENYPRRRATFLVAEEVEDTVSSEIVIQGQPPESYLDGFYRFVEENSDQIEALQILRQRPQDWGVNALEELRSKLKENRFTEENLQRAYKLVRQKALADLISLIRSAFDHSYPVFTAEERVERAIASVTDGKQFTDEQLQWLGYIKQHLIQNLSIDLDDFEYAPIFELYGGKGKAKRVFGTDFNNLIRDLNSAIAA